MSLTDSRPADRPEDVPAMWDGDPQSLGWTRYANCKGKTKLFFAPKAERPQARARREAKAKSLCDGCMVRSECREFARTNREYGYWGGESEEERHVLGFTVAAPIGIRGAKYRDAEISRS